MVLTDLYRKFILDDTSLDDTKDLVRNSSNDRISYLLSVSDSRMRFEIIMCLLSELPILRNKYLLNPYTETLKLIKGLKENQSKEIIDELYFLAEEQVKTKYSPIGTYEITRLLKNK